MSPARTSDHGIDLAKLLHRILLDLHLFKWFALHRRSLAAISAIAGARRVGENGDMPILGFIEKWIGDAPPDNTPPPAA